MNLLRYLFYQPKGGMTTGMFLLSITCFLALVLGKVEVKAQSAVKFAMPTQVPLYYNPGFAGSLSDGRVTLTYRNQWSGLNNNPQVFYASWDQLAPRLLGGIGGVMHLGVEGPWRQGSAGIVWSPKFQLGGKLTVAPAIGTKLSFTTLRVDSGLYIGPPGVNTTHWYGDLQTGLLVNSRSFYLGGAMQQMIGTAPDFIPNDGIKPQLSRSWSVQSGYTFKPAEYSDWSVSLNALAMWQRSFSIYQGMASARFQVLIFGLGADSGGDLLIMGGFKSDQFKATYTYSRITSSLGQNAWGSNELSLLIYLR